MAKQNVIGPRRAGIPQPAWDRRNVGNSQPNPSSNPPIGSKVFIRGLPADVGEHEIGELFSKTIGPLRDHFLIYNNQGRSKGYAIVEFQRKTDAAAAVARYDKIMMDGRRLISVETIGGDGAARPAAPRVENPPSLAARLAKPLPTQPRAASGKGRPPPARPTQQAAPQQQQPPSRRIRTKKGAKRVSKAGVYVPKPATRQRLDDEMDQWAKTA